MPCSDGAVFAFPQQQWSKVPIGVSFREDNHETRADDVDPSSLRRGRGRLRTGWHRSRSTEQAFTSREVTADSEAGTSKGAYNSQTSSLITSLIASQHQAPPCSLGAAFSLGPTAFQFRPTFANHSPQQKTEGVVRFLDVSEHPHGRTKAPETRPGSLAQPHP